MNFKCVFFCTENNLLDNLNICIQQNLDWLLLADINIHLFITDLESNVTIRREYQGTAARILQVNI